MGSFMLFGETMSRDMTYDIRYVLGYIFRLEIYAVNNRQDPYYVYDECDV